MNKLAVYIVVCGISCWAGYTVGWITAHNTVATECTKLGSFYVGNRVFKCIEVSTKEHK